MGKGVALGESGYDGAMYNMLWVQRVGGTNLRITEEVAYWAFKAGLA